jgi:hypothetical protein
VVDRSLDSSLESLAADRGITICFADLEGADGLWLPEERTILLARGLTSKQAADVLEHELSHVDIEDGHAALDAAMHRPVGRARWAVAGTVAASMALIVGIQQFESKPGADSHPAPPVAVAPSHTAGNPPPTSAGSPSTRVIMVNGEIRTQTVTVTPPPPASPTGTPVSTRAVIEGQRTPTAPTKSDLAPATATSSQPPGVASETTPPVTTTTPPVDTSTPSLQPSLSGANVT